MLTYLDYAGGTSRSTQIDFESCRIQIHKVDGFIDRSFVQHFSTEKWSTSIFFDENFEDVIGQQDVVFVFDQTTT